MTFDQQSSSVQQQPQSRGASMDDSFAVQNDFVKLEDEAETTTVTAKNSAYQVTLNEQSTESN